MAAFLHHCPFLKSAPKPALRRTGAALLSMADQCPIIVRQISVSATASLEAEANVSHRLKSPRLPTEVQRRQLAQTATQVAVSVSKGCPFVTSQIGLVRASPEVQEDVREGTIVLRHGADEPNVRPKMATSHTDRPALLLHRFEDSEGFNGFNRPRIRSGKRCHPAPPRQHGYV